MSTIGHNLISCPENGNGRWYSCENKSLPIGCRGLTNSTGKVSVICDVDRVRMTVSKLIGDFFLLRAGYTT
jgi:hypothetical protein